MKILLPLSVLLFAIPGLARIENFNTLIQQQSDEARKTGADLKEAVSDLELPEEKLVFIKAPQQEITAPSAALPPQEPKPVLSSEATQFNEIGQELNEARQF